MDEPTPEDPATFGAEGIPAGAVLQRVAPHVDAAFYRTRNPELAGAGEDAAAHFCRAGWREGRDPNGWFSTDYYLHANPDVRAAGLNPFWHFLVQGSHEGRRARAAGAVWREAFDRATAPRPAPALPPPVSAPALGAPELRRLVGTACAGARGLVVAISHDRYVEVPGGTQLLIADEQRKFNGDRAVYLHLSPLLPGLGLAADGPAPLWLSVTLDGAVRGVATAGNVALALASITAGPAAQLPRLLALHALHGHRPEAIAEIAATLQPRHAFFWVHDYTAACASPRLLRNGIAFCHAPPPDSLACRVCAHGPGRPAHLARIRALFDAVPFHVVAPSQTALDVFLGATDLPARGALVHPHASLAPAEATAATDDGPPRVAFVGHAEYHKGWTRFRELVAAVGDCGAQFFHFASATELRALDGVTLVEAESSATRPFGMVRTLAEHRIDLVLALSPWPETFGYVAHEALAAGADLLALAGSGHVEQLARATEECLVLPDDTALAAFFRAGEATAHVRGRRAAGRAAFTLLHDGSTATIGFDPAVPPRTEAPDLHLLLRGIRIDGVETGGIGGSTCRRPAPTTPGARCGSARVPCAAPGSARATGAGSASRSPPYCSTASRCRSVTRVA